MQALGDLSPPGTRELSRFGQIFGLILLADLAVVVVFIVAIYLAVRWAVAYPAMVVEGIDLRAALRRSSELTHGRRLKVALTLFVVAILTGIVTAFALYGAAGVTGSVLDISSAAGLVVSSVPVIARIRAPGAVRAAHPRAPLSRPDRRTRAGWISAG